MLILGAGASCHHGYPSGNKLIENIKFTLKKQKFYFGYHQNGSLTELEKEYEHFIRRGQVIERTYKLLEEFNPIYKSFYEELINQSPVESIDKFLKDNPEYHEIGKRLIAYEILKCENKDLPEKVIENDWYGQLTTHITKNCQTAEEILSNKLKIITFNYDVSLEYSVYKKLSGMSAYKYENGNYAKEYAKVLFEKNTVHMYGSIRPIVLDELTNKYAEKINLSNPPKGIFANHEGQIYKATYAWILAREAATGIQVIGENKQKTLTDYPHTQKAIKLINESEKVFILGFGFDEMNIALLKLQDLRPSNKEIFYTNYNRQKKLKIIAKELFGIKAQESENSVFKALEDDFYLSRLSYNKPNNCNV